MRILLAFLDSGGGHRSAARAVAAALAARAPGVEVALDDVGRDAPVLLVGDAPGAYRLLLDSPIRPLFDVAWRALDRRPAAGALVAGFYPFVQHHLLNGIQRHRPDLIVGVHAGVSQVYGRLRREHGGRYGLATVVTDLVSVHALWADPHTDLCLVPTAEAELSVLRRGVPRHRVCRAGFPIHPDFARLAAELPPGIGELHDLPRVLLMGGGAGAGGIEAMLAGLERVGRPLRIEVVTGHNAPLRQRLDARTYRHDVRIHGFVTEMAPLMASCDVVVSKAGPGSLIEAWSLRRPTLVGRAVGPQERGNLEWGARHGLAWPAGGPRQVGPRLERLLDRWQEIARGMRPIPTDGADRIAGELLNLAGCAAEPAR